MEEVTNKEVQLCADGKYRWVYEMHLLKNPTIFLTVLKVMGIALGIVWLFGIVVAAIQGDLDGGYFLFWLKVIAIIAGIMIVLTGLSILILAAIMGGKYVVLFEMDETQVVHIQMPRQVKKAQLIGAITALVGLAAKNPTTVGVGILSTAKSRSTSEFDKVRSVKAYPKCHLIKVNQLLFKNKVYVSPEDFDFVYNFIKSRCPKVQ